jgi:hypothetical protein
MWKSIKALDRILKGEVTRTEALKSGTLDLPLGGLSVVILILGAFYGACMGAYGIITRHGTPQVAMAYKQLGASSAKVPALFFLTLLVTFPSLYVFNALVGSRLSLTSMLRLLVAALGVMMALLASFGTIAVFFAVSTDSYSFMVLLNVVLFAVAGFMGLGFLLQTLHRLYNAQFNVPPPLPSMTEAPLVEGEPAFPEPSMDPGALDRLEGQVSSRNVRHVFRIWVLVFGLVGAQMGWVMRPFIGDPHKPFALFRPRESNFFQAVVDTSLRLMSGDDDHSKSRWHDDKRPSSAPSASPSSQPESISR